MMKRCLITRYDEKITEPPFCTIPIDTMEVMQPLKDNLGEEFVIRLQQGCSEKGYVFKFYSTHSSDDYDYEVVVY